MAKRSQYSGSLAVTANAKWPENAALTIFGYDDSNCLMLVQLNARYS